MTVDSGWTARALCDPRQPSQFGRGVREGPVVHHPCLASLLLPHRGGGVTSLSDVCSPGSKGHSPGYVDHQGFLVPTIHCRGLGVVRTLRPPAGQLAQKFGGGTGVRGHQGSPGNLDVAPGGVSAAQARTRSCSHRRGPWELRAHRACVCQNLSLNSTPGAWHHSV